MSRTSQRLTTATPRCECRDTAALLIEQTKMIAALKDEIEALHSTYDRVAIEMMWRIENARLATAGADSASASRASVDQLQVAPPPLSSAPIEEPAKPTAEKQPAMGGAEYSRLVTRIRSLARTVLPVNAVVSVISRGDEALVELEGRIAWHFPRLEDGRWVGHHPADDDEAVAHLELARRRGARYLLIPVTALWWLDHYDNFRQHLDATAVPILRHDDACRIFALNAPGAA